MAGEFYPADARILSGMIDDYLSRASARSVEGDIFALISPHAGYIYSGPIAAYGFKAVKGKKYSTVIIIAPSHYINYYYFDGASVYPSGFFQTPLGLVSIDEDITSKLLKAHKKIFFFPEAYLREHSLEVQIPFLQRAFGEFKIVPVLFGDVSYENCEILAGALAEIIKDRKDVLVVASTDMSHYHPYEVAMEMDGRAIKALRKMDPHSLFEGLAVRDFELCGEGPVITTLLLAKKLGKDKISVLKYANSGDTAGMKKSVVGYLSAVIYSGTQAEQEESEGSMLKLTDAEKKRLLEIARATMVAYVTDGKKLDFKESDPVLNRPMGAFVTLHKNGELRGCIGNIVGRGPFYLTVRDMAIASSTEDPRFPPVKPNELKDIEIEISALSELEETMDPNKIQMGVHGVIVKQGFRSGVFLPQVATETGWTREEFLSNLCAHKAGLPADAWKKGAQLFTFTAEVFSERDFKE